MLQTFAGAGENVYKRSKDVRCWLWPRSMSKTKRFLLWSLRVPGASNMLGYSPPFYNLRYSILHIPHVITGNFLHLVKPMFEFACTRSLTFAAERLSLGNHGVDSIQTNCERASSYHPPRWVIDFFPWLLPSKLITMTNLSRPQDQQWWNRASHRFMYRR